MIAQTVVAEVGLDMSNGQRKHTLPPGWGCVRTTKSRRQGVPSRNPPRGEAGGHGLPHGGHEFVAHQDVLGAKFKRLRAHLGAPKRSPHGHTLARLVYRMLKHGQDYVDKGMDSTSSAINNSKSTGCRRWPKI